MNLAVAIASSTDTSASQFQSLSSRLEGVYGGKPQVLPTASENVSLAFISDGGTILGTAVGEEASLAFIGSFLNTLPDWGSGSPLDDPNRTARYLLSRYHDRGTHFLDKLTGNYIVALYDNNRSKLLLACDPTGFRRLFYHSTPEALLFSSKLSALALALGDDLALDRSLEDFLLGFEFLPWNRTPYQGVKVLDQGTILEWRNGNIETHPIESCDPWREEPHVFDITDCSEDGIINILYDAYMTAIEDQLPTTGKLGVLLGGLDSALVASALKRLGRDVETFTFGFDEPYYNQKHTDTLASYIHCLHNWVHINPDVIRDGLQHYSYRFNQVASQSHYPIQTEYACTQIRKRGIHCCFTGDGCDGTFLGYPHVYRRTRLFKRLGRIPPTALKFFLLLLRPAILERHLGHVCRLARNYLTIWGRKMPAQGHIAFRIYDDFALNRLRTTLPPPQEKDSEEILDELATGLEHLSPVRLAYHGKSAPGLNRTKIEGSSDSTGLIIHSPYLHPGMMRFASQLPDKLLRPDKTEISLASGKYILVRMAEEKRLLPSSILYQEKRSPVASPIDSWYADPLRPMVYELLDDLPFPYSNAYVDNLLRPKIAETLFRKLLTVDHIASHAVSILLTYSSFAKISTRRKESVPDHFPTSP